MKAVKGLQSEFPRDRGILSIWVQPAFVMKQ